MKDFNEFEYNKNFDFDNEEKFSEEVVDAEIVENTQGGEENSSWKSDDYEKSLISTFDFKNEKKVKFVMPNMKKYVAVAVCAAILNMSIFAGVFYAGYYFGGNKSGRLGKNSVVQNYNNGSGSNNQAGATQTVDNGIELSTVEISKTF